MWQRFLKRRYLLCVQMLLKNPENLGFAGRLAGVLNAHEPSFENIREFRLKRGGVGLRKRNFGLDPPDQPRGQFANS